MPLYFLTVPHDSAEEPTMESMRETDPAEIEATIAAMMAFNTALQEAGALKIAGGLMPPSTATTIDGSGDVPTSTPGPFVEAAEYVGGFWVIEVPDERAALDWGTRAAQALQGRVEVRALQENP